MPQQRDTIDRLFRGRNLLKLGLVSQLLILLTDSFNYGSTSSSHYDCKYFFIRTHALYSAHT